MAEHFSDKVEFRARREPWTIDGISIRMARFVVRDGVQAVLLASEVTFDDVTDKQLRVEQPAMMTIRPDEAQQLMDELWRANIRPTEGAGSVGQMAACEKHLEDMRRLVFKEKGKES